jgi:ParB family chromosome partitioning protein
MQFHKLKTQNPYFKQTWMKNKTFEVRKNDRDFQVGDFVILMYYNAQNPTNDLQISNQLKDCWHDHYIVGKITFLLDDPMYCKENYVIFNLEILSSSFEGAD